MVSVSEKVGAQELTSQPATPQSLNVERQSQIDRTRQQACLAARVLADTRGQDVLVLDLTNVTPIVDFFVIATGTSVRQMRSMAEEVHKVLKHEGSRRRGSEGDVASPWLLQDYGDIVVHVFSQDARQLYDLEHLWADAPRVDWVSIAPPIAPRY